MTVVPVKETNFVVISTFSLSRHFDKLLCKQSSRSLLNSNSFVRLSMRDHVSL